MIAVDTNILVYAHRLDSPFNERARECVRQLAEGSAGWAIPWPCVHEFLSITTHPKIYKPPTPLEVALEQVECWMESPSLLMLGETGRYWDELKDIVTKGKITGPMIHDARVASICRYHGVRTLWSADRDFSSFPKLTVRNPLMKAGK